MTIGISLHIGLNQIDPSHYGTDGLLRGCENDARSMEEIASYLDYKTELLLSKSARAEAIIGKIREASQSLRPGDTFFISFAGHGSQIKDLNADEYDQLDETWCAFDRMIIDDELRSLWSTFEAGVKIIQVSDSCHSGTVLRDVLGELESIRRLQLIFTREPNDNSDEILFRTLSRSDTDRAVQNNRQLYDSIQVVSRDRPNIGASVISLSACEDNQTASDGINNGLFTQKLIDVWRGGAYEGDYRSFMKEIRRRMPPHQSPVLLEEVNASTLVGELPFSLNTSALSTNLSLESLNTSGTYDMNKSRANDNWMEVSEVLYHELSSRGVDLNEMILAQSRSAEQGGPSRARSFAMWQDVSSELERERAASREPLPSLDRLIEAQSRLGHVDKCLNQRRAEMTSMKPR